jgi:hypothetical protein
MSAVNYVATSAGKVRAVCEFCDKRSAPVRADDDGEPCMWSVGRGWASAPYPHDFVHRDGSTGSTWICPDCNRRLNAGESLRVHASRGAVRVVTNV